MSPLGGRQTASAVNQIARLAFRDLTSSLEPPCTAAHVARRRSQHWLADDALRRTLGDVELADKILRTGRIRFFNGLLTGKSFARPGPPRPSFVLPEDVAVLKSLIGVNPRFLIWLQAVDRGTGCLDCSGSFNAASSKPAASPTLSGCQG